MRIYFLLLMCSPLFVQRNTSCQEAMRRIYSTGNVEYTISDTNNSLCQMNGYNNIYMIHDMA